MEEVERKVDLARTVSTEVLAVLRWEEAEVLKEGLAHYLTAVLEVLSQPRKVCAKRAVGSGVSCL